MAEKKNKRPRDFNQMAASILEDATDETPPEPIDPAKAAAIEHGREGGRKGGKIRAQKLTPEQRSEIARRAARKRWGKK